VLLADDVIEPLRPQPVGERARRRRPFRSLLLEEVRHPLI
jgi:hypothetical protein